MIYRSWQPSPQSEGAFRLLVLKLDHIGDFWMALGPLKELRSRFRDAHITLVVGSWNLETALRFQLADDYVTFDFFARSPKSGQKRKAPEDLLELLPAQAFDLAMDMRVPDDTRCVLLAVRAHQRAAIVDRYRHPQIDIAISPGRLKLRRSPAYKLLQKLSLSSWIPRRWVDKHADRDQLQLQHVAETLTQLVARASADVDEQRNGRREPRQPVDEDAPIVVAPFSNSALRDWPLQSFQELIARLPPEHRVVVVGRDEDVAALRSSAGKAEALGAGRVEIATGLSEQEFNQLLSSAALVISNNSGAGHVAAQLGRPTIGIFTASHLPELWGFRGPLVSMLMSSIECRGCGIDVVRRCPEHVRCKFDITVDHVLAEIAALTQREVQASPAILSNVA
ncbi:glycosyltransferase family 9 protein [Kaistia defluvii]|uniref:glycosyltransferase family 9 protein n=1 Tax=Kaistia defluvii TaxID=410841 RepID=UPI002251FB02|nr:glycosyltransferase family 9 protein [Kaistia defluvii]MCX5518987.1 glycosyltransferase family 9 protein [Kaistia defluvii]